MNNAIEKPLAFKPEDPAPPKNKVILVKMDTMKEGNRVGIYNIPGAGQIALGNQLFKIQRIRSNRSMVLKPCKK